MADDELVGKLSFDLNTKEIGDLRAEVVKGRIADAVLKSVDLHAPGRNFSLSFGLSWRGSLTT